jgi:N6-adenosine-specific RNA methylase IME4
MIDKGLEVMDSWGFKLKQTFVWVKLKKNFAEEEDWNKGTRFGMGRLFRQSHEIALIGTYGKSVYPRLKNNSQRSVAFDLNKGHSIKPDTLQDRLDIMFPSTSKLEIFARRNKSGWTCIGDGVTGVDVRDSIKNLQDT